MLTTNDAGLLEAASLPAENDPMLARVKDMRVRHHVFIDTVDEYYGALHEEMVQAYIMWRRHSYDQRSNLSVANRSLLARISSAAAWLSHDDTALQPLPLEQDLPAGISGAGCRINQELAPAILELNEQVHGLSGTMAEQYIQWRRILRQLFELETGSI